MQEELYKLWGSQIDSIDFDFWNRHCIIIDIKLITSEGHSYQRLIFEEVMSFMFIDYSISRLGSIATPWNYIELTSITLTHQSQLGRTWNRITIEMWESKLEVDCAELKILQKPG